MKILTERTNRKSELLTKEEFSILKKYVASHNTVVDAASALGIGRQTLDRVLIIGKGAPETINAIREKINELQAA